jgi:phosphoribosylformylglycinamidine (FGAM) synthase PurS component
MQKFTTTSKKTDLNNRLEKSDILQPKAATLRKILQFASSYRVTQVNENQFIELNLN